MIKERGLIMRTDSGWLLCVDGGSAECGSDAELMARIGMEVGMPYNKAQRQLFERMEAAETQVECLHSMVKTGEKAIAELRAENEMLRAAIVRWFVKAFKEG